ncbi:Long_chain fatty acid CoA ligase [Hexamita inflata]|uniref:Long chain fatty acid CoA ligase n=1 Tax=Hexamita inflata TaxID=28002 RepID=A0AA86NBR9_9EUKA|nr:Long chain fatty acid CoA ligase [Hexamita inflata]
MQVKNHDFKSASHLALDASQELDMNKTVPQNFMDGSLRFYELPFLAHRAGLSTNAKMIVDYYTKITFAESYIYIDKICQTLKEAGVEKGDRCMIYAKNSPLWLLSDIAVSFVDGITSPVYDTLGLENIIYCINLVQAKCIFVSQDYLANIIGSLELIPSIKTVICFDAIDKEALKIAARKVVLSNGGQGVKIIDDNKSMYSMNSHNTASTEEEVAPVSAVDFSSLDQMIHDLGNDQVKVKTLTFNVSSDEEKYKSQLLEAKHSLLSRLALLESTKDSINATVFTSGTSGKPKAVLESHQNLACGLSCEGYRFVPYHLDSKGRQNSVISYLPLAHVFERAVEHGAYKRGHLIYYSTGNIKYLTKDLSLSKPTMMYGVPRVYCKIYQSVMGKIAKSSLPVKIIFKTAYKLKKQYLKNPKHHKTGKMKLVEPIFKAIHEQMGGNLEFIVSGSSALPQEVREFLEICTGARVSSGYGLTEASSAGTYNYCGQHYNSPNQLGYACHLADCKIIDRSDKCEFTLENHQTGELLIKGPMVTQGYIDGQWGKVKKITDADGYYPTGDLVKLHEDGAVSFIRRVGLVVKLQHGEFVDLEAIEAALEGCPLIQQCFVHGESDKSAPICFASVDSQALKEKISVEVIERFKQNEKAAIAEVEKFILDYGDKQVRQAGLKGFNVPKAYKVLLDHDWSQNTEFYTPSQKKKHAGFIAAHKKEVEQLFEMVKVRETEGKSDNKGKIEKAPGKGSMLIVITFVVLVAILIKLLAK